MSVDIATLELRRARLGALLDPAIGALVVYAGEPIGKPGGQDQTYPFVPHPEYYWLTGVSRPGGVLAFDRATGWTHFVVPVSAEERLWTGGQDEVPGDDIAGVRAWIASRSANGFATLGAVPPGMPKPSDAVRAQVDALRRVKDAAEIAIVERAVRATAAAYEAARATIRPGVTERAVQIEMEAAMARHGASGPGYTTIVAAGERSAILHLEPGPRVIGDRELVLIDAGAEVEGYTADVTRTFAADGRFTAEQQTIYGIVLAAQLAAIALCRARTEWREVHRASARVIATGLRDLGILRGEVDGLLERGAVALFFPHGIGHMVGLGVRDAGGAAPGRSPDARVCGVRLRVDLPLEAGFLMTVEPGLYFVPAMLDDAERRARFADAVDWSRVDAWRGFGGVRIEDDVLITDRDPIVLTQAIPKDV